MKIIKLKNFKLESFDYDNKEHYNMISKFDRDKMINKFLITCSDSFSELVDFYNLSNEESIYNKLYMVKNNNGEIIGSIELDGAADDLYLNYSILEEFRCNGYCTKLLKEITKLLLSEIKKISLLIKKENEKSKNLALRVGYEELGYDGYGYYKYQINAQN